MFAPARFGEWLLGAAVAQMFASGALRRVRPGARATLLACGWALVVGGLAAVAATGADEHWTDMPASLGFALIVAAMVAHEDQLPIAVTGSRWATWLGERSYSLYVVHYTVIQSIVTVISRLAGRSSSAEKDALGGTWWMFLATVLAVLAIPLVAEASYRLIERPSHEAGRRMAARVTAVASAA